MADIIFEGLGIEGLEHFAGFLEKRASAFELPFFAATEAISFALEEKVLEVFGDNTKLADLAPATQAEREALGYEANEPLFRDGALLKDHIEREAQGLVAGVGSAEPVQLYHEMGYINARTGNPVPPRPVFEIGLKDSEVAVTEILGAATQVALGDNPMLIGEALAKHTKG